MFHWLFQNTSNKVRVSQDLVLAQTPDSTGPTILSGRVRFVPMDFAHATNGFIYFSDGFGPVIKWDGISNQASEAGVPAPATALTIGASGSGSIDGTYTAYQRYVDIDNNVSNLSPVSNSLVVVSRSQIDYTGVPTTMDSRVVKRQIIRNTSGQNSVYYVDVETTDLSATTFTSTQTDSLLATNEAVALFDNAGVSLANKNGIPRTDKPIIAYFSGRLFMAGDKAYKTGHVAVTFQSKTVTGVGTQFNTSMEERFIYISGSNREYEIDTVNETTQVITLLDNFEDVSDLFASYVIRSPPASRTLLSFSESNQFDAWPATQALEIASSDDLEEQITGLLPTSSFLFVLQRRHIYRLSFLNDPQSDGGIFLAARRGCVNNRCWVNVDDSTYMLDDRGIYRFSGTEAVEDLSLSIQDLFYFYEDSPSGFSVNWDAAELFHAGHDRNRAIIRWFVAFSGNQLPRHAICYNYVINQFWIEEYPWPIGASEQIRSETTTSVVAGATVKLFAMDTGTLDGVDPSAGDTRGDVLSSGPFSLTTINTTVPVANVVQSPISIVSGRGKGQTRIISSVTGQVIRVAQPWNVLPDTTSKFQIGGIKWRWKSGESRFVGGEQQQTRRITVGFRSTRSPASLDIRQYRDYSRDPENFTIDYPRTPAESSGVTIMKNEPDALVDLTLPNGFAQVRLDDFTEYNVWRDDLISVELRGFTSEDPVRIYSLRIEGAQ